VDALSAVAERGGGVRCLPLPLARLRGFGIMALAAIGSPASVRPFVLLVVALGPASGTAGVSAGADGLVTARPPGREWHVYVAN